MIALYFQRHYSFGPLTNTLVLKLRFFMFLYAVYNIKVAHAYVDLENSRKYSGNSHNILEKCLKYEKNALCRVKSYFTNDECYIISIKKIFAILSLRWEWFSANIRGIFVAENDGLIKYQIKVVIKTRQLNCSCLIGERLPNDLLQMF